MVPSLGAVRAAGKLRFPGKSSGSQLLMTKSAFPQTLCQPVQTDLPERCSRCPEAPSFRMFSRKAPTQLQDAARALRLRAVIPWKAFVACSRSCCICEAGC